MSLKKYLEYLVFTKWASALAEGLGLGTLEPTTSSETPSSRTMGSDAARLVRELRDRRSERVAFGGA